MGRTFWVLLAALFVNRLCGMVGPFLPVWLHVERGLDEAAVGLVLTASGAVGLLAAPLGGWVADRLGRRPAILGGFALQALSLALLPGAPALALGAALAFRGFAHDLSRPAVTAAITDVTGPARRARAFGLFRVAVNLGFGLGTLLAGWLAAHGFGLLFALEAAVTALTGLALARLLPETRPAAAAAPCGEGAGRSTGASHEEPGARAPLGALLAVLLAALVVTAVAAQLMTTLPLSVARRGAGDATLLYGRLLALNAVVCVVGQFPITRLLERARPTTALALGALLYAAGYGLVGRSVEPLPLGLAVLLLTLGEVAFYPTVATAVAALAPAATRGRWFGAMSLAFGLGHVLAPLLGTTALVRWGDAALWGLAPLVGCAAALGLLAVGRHPVWAGASPDAPAPAGAEPERAATHASARRSAASPRAAVVVTAT